METMIRQSPCNSIACRAFHQRMTVAPPEMVLVADDELQRLADEKGPASAEAQALAQLKTQRSQDLQVHCFRVGDTYLTGPLPEATEPASADGELIEALKRAKDD
jgi:hypothetical protein